MEIKVQGKRDDDAKIAIRLKPEYASTIVLGEGGNAKIITPKSSFTSIGKIPMKIGLYLMFNKRPWSFSLQLEGGSVFKTSNLEQGLKTTTILTPDILPFSLNFTDGQEDEDDSA